MARLSWRRREVNYWIDMVALAAGAIVFATGLVLLTQFHAGRGTLNNAALGLSRLAWLNIHRLTAIALFVGGLAHALLHWRILLTRLTRVWNDHPGRASRADLILYFGFAIELLAGFSSWLFFPGSAPLWGPIRLGPLEHSRHICIDLHNFTGLIVLPAIIIHVRRHWHFILPAPALAWTARTPRRTNRRSTAMEVNNAIYEDHGHAWWDENAGFELSSLRYCVNPLRYTYFNARLENIVPGNSMLDIGCGGGFLSEQFAADGFVVTGIDPSAKSIAAARKHAAQSTLAIQYHVARGEALPFPDASFDVVACCDVLEHVDRVADVIREAARTLKPGGVFLYDTINRTLKSKVLMIKIWQDWGVAGFSARAHVWEKFIRPDEMEAMMSANRLTPIGLKGIAPAKNPFAVLCALRRIRLRRICGPEIGRAFPMRETNDLSVSYMGLAVRK